MTSLNNRQNYDRSERRAWWSATGLWDVLVNLRKNQQDHVRVLAHSMGNIVASEALRFQGLKTNALPVIQSYIATQAASVAHAYDSVNPQRLNLVPVYSNFPRGRTNVPYFTGMKNAVGQDPTTHSPNIVNYQNSVDYALTVATTTWPLDQLVKPDVGYAESLDQTISYNSYHWYSLPNVELKIKSDYYEIFAFAAPASSKALGAAEDTTYHVLGEIGSAINLRNPPFGFTGSTNDHSAEFNSINMNRRLYWWQVLTTFSLTNGLPLP